MVYGGHMFRHLEYGRRRNRARKRQVRLLPCRHQGGKRGAGIAGRVTALHPGSCHHGGTPGTVSIRAHLPAGHARGRRMGGVLSRCGRPRHLNGEQGDAQNQPHHATLA